MYKNLTLISVFFLQFHFYLFLLLLKDREGSHDGFWILVEISILSLDEELQGDGLFSWSAKHIAQSWCEFQSTINISTIVSCTDRKQILFLECVPLKDLVVLWPVFPE